MLHHEDSGMSEREFAKTQGDLEKENSARAGRERARQLKLFFEFDSGKKRDWARATLYRLRSQGEHEDQFRFFEDCIVDPKRPDVGMEIVFLRNPDGLKKEFERLLADEGIMPLEEYETVDDEPRPEETEIRRTA
jgi:Fe-S oxidoreductase